MRTYRFPSAKNKTTKLIAVVVIFHLAGLAGLLFSPMQPAFLKLVPYHLLLMLVVIVISHKPFDGRFVLFALFIFVAAFAAEWTGIHKSWLFGNYAYGSILGTKLDGVPLIISVNWFLLVYSAGVLMQRSKIKSIYLRVITGALILVLLDTLIEPVAQSFNYWHWAGNIVPAKNYICWFLVSAAMLYVFEKFGFKKQSIVAPVFLLMQFLFFIALY